MAENLRKKFTPHAMAPLHFSRRPNNHESNFIRTTGQSAHWALAPNTREFGWPEYCLWHREGRTFSKDSLPFLESLWFDGENNMLFCDHIKTWDELPWIFVIIIIIARKSNYKWIFTPIWSKETFDITIHQIVETFIRWLYQKTNRAPTIFTDLRCLTRSLMVAPSWLS